MKEHRHTTYWKHVLKDFDFEWENVMFLVGFLIVFGFIWIKWGWYWSVTAYFLISAFGRFSD